MSVSQRESSWLDRILQVHKTVDRIWSPVLFLVHNYEGEACDAVLGNVGTFSFDFDTLFWEHVVRMSEWTEGWSLRLLWEGLSASV